jgi:hypothetical protein
MIVLSGIFCTVASASTGWDVIAAIAVSLHVIIFILHRIEVKLNRLLNDRQILIPKEELD